MEQKKKTILMSIIIVVCLITAIMIYYQSASSNRFGELKGQKMWVKCIDPKCGVEYELEKSLFFEELEKKGPMAESIVCQKCQKPTACRAVKCPKCQIIFLERAAGREDYPDRCPKCRFSETEGPTVTQQ